MIAIGWLFSRHKRHVYWRTIIWGTALQLTFALIVLKTGPGRAFFSAMNTAVVTFLGFTEEGARFVFGNLVRNNVPVGLPLGGGIDSPILPSSQTSWANTGAYFAFNVLPTIIFFSSFMTILYHLGVMQWVVKLMAIIMQKSMKTSGAESLSAAANIFVGQTEAPLVVRPYVSTMTESELMAVMTGGFATVAGGVMAAYVGMLSGSFPEIAGHLIAASVMSAPASLLIAKVMLPERGTPETAGRVRMTVEKPDVNVIDAAARGAGDGLNLALNVAAMLLAFVALLAALNYGLGELGGLVGLDGLSLQRILAVVFWPVAWLMGTPLSDCGTVAMLLGEKVVLTEFVAYLHLGDILASGTPMTYRGVVIATYALCGFANFGSIAIQIGGIGGIAPGRRHDLARLGLRAMIGGTLAANMTATIAGMLV
ncbi:MAG: NupC/NupG family nucleoside CNT transporter [Candidatus Eisenbacteria bacterium]|nr:NupC/NupG family nucleoside CNT transporter [Candidatus Eisenbacteria bacterium]